MLKKTVLFLALLWFSALNANDKIKIDYQNPQKPKIVVTISDKMFNDLVKNNHLDKNKAKKVLKIKMLKDGKQAKFDLSGNIKIDISQDNPQLIFTPSNYLDEDFKFVAIYKNSSKTYQKKFQAKALDAPFTMPRVQNFYPQGKTVPMNIKFFHFVFSVPMLPSVPADKFIKVYHNQKEIMAGEKRLKWSRDGTRLSIIIHPSGHLHGGKNPSHGKQPAFYEDKQYKIVLNNNLKDIYGRAMRPFEYSFKASSRDMTRSCIKKVDITTPKKESFEPLKLKFSEPMDYWMIHKNAKIDMQGYWSVKKNNRFWQFNPTKKWQKRTYKLNISRGITDLSSWKLSQKNGCIDIFSF